MFQGMFDTPQQILSGVNEGAVLSSWQRLPKNCADLLLLPQKSRKQGFPIGLKNQGATCYLNSFLQILFHTPQLRKTILDLPLCQGNIDQKSNFVNHAKHNFLFGFQRLFSEMSIKNSYAVETDYLNKAFGWEGKEHVEQQDMTEAMKIIFDTMQRALFGTPYQLSMKSLFKGTSARYKTCRNCTISEERDEDFYDLNVLVKNFKSLSESLLASLTPETMQDDNKIFCESCQSKQDMWLGTRYKTFPNILVFTLNRFEFDYETFNRVKLNQYFQFNLEQSLVHLIDEGKEEEFQLYGVIIHRGSAHSGHYLAYIRDVLHQSNWQKSIQEAHRQKQKSQAEKTPLEALTEEQKKKRLQLEKQDEIRKLKQPDNRSLLENWYELNDSIVTAIDAKKITSKYEGSDSAYILFYRRRSFNANPMQMKVPEYFYNKINEQNQKAREQRQKYEYQRNHIILKINGNNEKLNIKTPISTLLNQFCPQGFSLVMQATHNNLPYYPLQLNPLSKDFKEDDTIQKFDIYHQSIWRTYLISDDEYLNIRQNIGKEKLPFEVNVVLDKNRSKIVVYQDQTFSDLRVRLANESNVPYENQIIELKTQYKQYFVTDELANDEALLTKLGFIHDCMINVKNLSPLDNKAKEGQIDEQKKQKDQFCFIIQRDDQIGVKKIFFSKYNTLEELLTHIILSENFNLDEKRRLRNLNGNRLYYLDHYSKQLDTLDFTEEMIKMRIEKGQIPVKGDVCVKAKLQSKFQQAPQNTIISKVFDPNTTIVDFKQQLCTQANLDPTMHRIYLTDWMGEPVRAITKESQSIFDSHFGREQTICIRDIESPIGSQLLHFEVFITETGSPDNISKDSFHVKSQIHKTILQFKQKLLEQDYIKEKYSRLLAKQLRIREIKRDYMYGNIWRNHQRQMKDVQINSNKIVIQILEGQEDLREDQVVVILKKRNIQKKLYEGSVELVFEAGKEPKIEDFEKAIKEKLGLGQEFPIVVIKYFNYNFEWVEVSTKELQKMANSNKKGEGNKQKQEKNKNKNKQNNMKKEGANQQKKVNQNKNEQDKIKEVQEKQKQIDDKKQSKNEQKQQNEKKSKKNKKVQNTQQNKLSKDYLNIRKAPTLLKDGDWIGWANSQQIKAFKDDLQTQQDLTLKFIKKSNKTANFSRGKQAQGFVINVGF